MGENGSRSSLDRRKFLSLAGMVPAGLAAGSLVGRSAFGMNAEAPLPDRLQHWYKVAPQGTFELSTQEHYGETAERLSLPPSWETKVYHMAGHNAPVLSGKEIQARLRHPIGTQPLRELAAGKKNAIVTFDDLTRPTPTFRILPHVIEELKAGGISENRILLLTSYGSHRPMVQSEVERKVGKEFASRFIWLNHNIWGQATEVGRTTLGNVIKINPHFARADLRVTISGVKIHGTAGYGGGGKAILPGLSWSEAIHYLHQTINGVGGNRNDTVGPAKIYKNECRKDIDEAARLARVDFSVQTLYNGSRQVVGIFAGDVVDAYRTACHKANRHFRTEVAHNADVVVINAYPQNAQPFNGLHWARRCLREGGSVVLITQYTPGTESIHYMRERWVYDPALLWDAERFPEWFVRNGSLEGTGQFIIYSGTMPARDRHRLPPGTHFADRWEDVVAKLRKAHRGDASVAVYPYAPLQHPLLEWTVAPRCSEGGIDSRRRYPPPD